MANNGRDRDREVLETLRSIDEAVALNGRKLSELQKTTKTVRDAVTGVRREIRSWGAQFLRVLREFRAKR